MMSWAQYLDTCAMKLAARGNGVASSIMMLSCTGLSCTRTGRDVINVYTFSPTAISQQIRYTGTARRAKHACYSKRWAPQQHLMQALSKLLCLPQLAQQACTLLSHINLLGFLKQLVLIVSSCHVTCCRVRSCQTCELGEDMLVPLGPEAPSQLCGHVINAARSLSHTSSDIMLVAYR